MNIATHIQRSWAELLGQLQHVGDDNHNFVVTIRDWLSRSAGSVSKIARAGLEAGVGVRRIQIGRPADLPLPLDAVDELRATEMPNDPRRFADAVNKLCWMLSVYRLEYDSCPECQGDLELHWSKGKTAIICGFLECGIIDLRTDALRPLPGDFRPARRDEVIASFPKAKLLGWKI